MGRGNNKKRSAELRRTAATGSAALEGNQAVHSGGVSSDTDGFTAAPYGDDVLHSDADKEQQARNREDAAVGSIGDYSGPDSSCTSQLSFWKRSHSNSSSGSGAECVTDSTSTAIDTAVDEEVICPSCEVQLVQRAPLDDDCTAAYPTAHHNPVAHHSHRTLHGPHTGAAVFGARKNKNCNDGGDGTPVYDSDRRAAYGDSGHGGGCGDASVGGGGMRCLICEGKTPHLGHGADIDAAVRSSRAQAYAPLMHGNNRDDCTAGGGVGGHYGCAQEDGQVPLLEYGQLSGRRHVPHPFWKFAMPFDSLPFGLLPQHNDTTGTDDTAGTGEGVAGDLVSSVGGDESYLDFSSNPFLNRAFCKSRRKKSRKKSRSGGMYRDGDDSFKSIFDRLCIGLTVAALLFLAGTFLLPTLLGLWSLDGRHGLSPTFGNKAFSENSNLKSLRGPVSFKDIWGLDEVKLDLLEVVDFFRKTSKFLDVGAKIPRGVLLQGPPGTGKTMLARAVAAEAGVPFLSASGSEFIEVFVGQGARRMRDLFDFARKSAPAIVFIDELDAIGGVRSGGGGGYGGNSREHDQTLNQLLVELDGFNNNAHTDANPVVIIAATNRVDILDPALLRAGRFDRVLHVGLPDANSRLAILQYYCNEVAIDNTVKVAFNAIASQGSQQPTANPPAVTPMSRLQNAISDLVQATYGFSGADIGNMVNEAAILAAREGSVTVTATHLQDARDRIVTGPERKSLNMPQHQREMTAYHEAGHALVAARLYPQADPVLKITIVPRAFSLGHVEQTPNEDRYTYKLSEAKARLAVSMGGRVAERLIFGEQAISSGASSDLRTATALARRMVGEWGMSTALGPFSVPAFQATATGRQLGPGQPNNNHLLLPSKLGDLLRVEVQQLLIEADNEAASILGRDMDKLHAVAQALLVQETMTGDELNSILDGHSAPRKIHQ